MSGINARPPTGKVPYPLILIEGPEKSGKSWAAALLSASAKVGQTYWLDLGEGASDEYGAIPGVRYQVLVHDGQWATILAQVEAVRAEAIRVAAAHEPPVVLIIDSASAEWEFLKDWASSRAARTATNRAKLRDDPNAEITVSTNFWNDSAARHRRLMTLLLTFPGVVVLTARGKVTVRMENGRPVEGQRSYAVEGHKSLAFDATVWVRLSRDTPPQIIGCRSVHAGIKPGKDKPKDIEDVPNLLEWLIFDVLKVDPAISEARDVQTFDGDKLTPEERIEADPASVAAEERERKTLTTSIRRAALAFTMLNDDAISADYTQRNQARIQDASIDDLRSYLTDLREEASRAELPGVPA